MDDQARDGESNGTLAEDLEGTPYRTIGPIGQGGMGAVYEIEHKTLGRRLVLKVLRAAGRPDLEDRLRFEAQTLAQLSHPNLLSVVDFGRTRSNRPYLVTELLRGRTLKDLLGAEGSLPVHQAARFAVQALEGLESAHRAGVIHRDVKTDNLFVCDAPKGGAPFLKVIDFGIAKIADNVETEMRVSVEPLMIPTAEGMMVGTPSYVSPEQIFGYKIDQRADIFSLGMVLFRMIAGRGPFQHRTVLELVESNARKPAPPPSSYATQHVPPELDALVLKALEKRPEDRFQSAKEMAEALAPFTVERPAPAPSPNAKEPVRTVVMSSPIAEAVSADEGQAATPLLAKPPPNAGFMKPSPQGAMTPRGTQRLFAGMDDTPPTGAPAFMPAPPVNAGWQAPPREQQAAHPMAAPPNNRDQHAMATTSGPSQAVRWVGLAVAIVVAGGLTFLLFRLLGWT